jgi:hypothetical protein
VVDDRINMLMRLRVEGKVMEFVVVSVDHAIGNTAKPLLGSTM